MTKQEKIKLYEQAIKEAEETLNDPSAPEAAKDAAEKVVASLDKKLIKMKDLQRLHGMKHYLDGKLI